MLKSKPLAILAVVVIVLGAIALMQKSSHERRTSLPAQAVLLDGAWTGDDLGRIALGHGGQPEVVVLERGPEGWTIPTSWHAQASAQRVDALLRVLGGLAGEFRSDRESVLADYGLTPEGSVTIRAWDTGGGEVIALDVGAQAQGAQGQFVRRPGQSAVYVAGANVLSALGLYGGPDRPTGRHFLDLQAVQEDKTQVDAIVLEDEHGARTLAKVFAPVPADSAAAAAEPQVDRLTWEWELTEPSREPLLKTRADGVLGAVTSVRAVDVDDPAGDPAAYGLDEPARRAILRFADGRELVLAFGAERPAADGSPAGVWLRAGDDPTVWVVTTYAVDGIFKTTQDLRPES
ncbi:MAG: DUF4340 domain-containing protein [Candidatus Krumholzibacteriia bacterium]